MKGNNYTNDSRIKIAIVGCGRISKNHIKSIALLNNLCKLVAICDLNEDNLDKAYSLSKELFKEKDLNDLEKFRDYSKLIESSKNNHIKISCIFICKVS